MALSRKRELADVVINNRGPADALIDQLNRCFQRLPEPLRDHPFAARLHRHRFMQGGVGAAIGLEVIPGECISRHGRQQRPRRLKQVSPPRSSIEVDHHRQVRWPPLAVCLAYSLVPGTNQSVCSLVLAGVMALALDRF